MRVKFKGQNRIKTDHESSGHQARHLNFSTSAAGGIRIEVQDKAGKVIPGFSLFECHEVIGNEIEREVSWESEGDLGSLAGNAGKEVRLRMVMKGVDLFALRFGE